MEYVRSRVNAYEYTLYNIEFPEVNAKIQAKAVFIVDGTILKAGLICDKIR